MSLANDPDNPVVPDTSITRALLHNNALPFLDQVSIHELITSFEDEVRKLDPEIARVQNVLHELQSRRSTIIAEIHSCRIAIAPHRKLPNEILAKIFIHAASEKVSIVVPNGHTECFPPYNILLVCSRWRDVALGERRLWNNVEVNFDDISPNFCPRNFARSGGVVLDRTALSPISLTILLNFSSAPNSFPKMIQNFLMRSERRLNTLVLDMGHIQRQILCDISSGFFERLETVSITIDTALHTYDTATLFEDASELRKFTITTKNRFCPCFFAPTMFPLPWAQLTSLHFGAMVALHPSDAHAMLSQCTSLVRCTISVRAPGNPPAKIPSTIMPSLRKLRLVLYNESNHWLPYFCFPSLTTLELGCVPCFGIKSLYSELDLDPRNLLKLSSLKVNLDMSRPILEKLLQNVPTLALLTLPGRNSVPEDILAKIADGSLVPRLKHLVCRVDLLSRGLDMILKDTRATTIGDVTIFYARCRDAEDRERIATLRKCGLSIDTSPQL